MSPDNAQERLTHLTPKPWCSCPTPSIPAGGTRVFSHQKSHWDCLVIKIQWSVNGIALMLAALAWIIELQSPHIKAKHLRSLRRLILSGPQLFPPGKNDSKFCISYYPLCTWHQLLSFMIIFLSLQVQGWGWGGEWLWRLNIIQLCHGVWRKSR